MKNKVFKESRLTKKRGFTIVELVIVIAVIAILAAVAIPTFAGIVRKARISAKVQNTENINKILAVSEITDGRPASMHDAITVLQNNGFGTDVFVEDNGMLLVWDRLTNRVFAVDSELNELNGETITVDKLNLWQVVDEMPETTSAGLYLCDKISETSVEVGVGVDLGSNTNVKEVIYTDSDNDEKTPLIRANANDCNITVNNNSDNIDVVGLAAAITMSSSETNQINRLNTYGKLNELNISSGNAVVKSGAYVETAYIPVSNDDSLVLTEGAGFICISGDTFSLTIEEGAYVGKIVGIDGNEIDFSDDTQPDDIVPPINPDDTGDNDQPTSSENSGNGEEEESHYDFEIFDTSDLDYSLGAQAYVYDPSISDESQKYMSIDNAISSKYSNSTVEINGRKYIYVVLLRDLEENDDYNASYTLDVKDNLILDLNGHTLGNYKSNYTKIEVNSGVHLRVIDTSDDNSGKIISSDQTGKARDGISVEENAELTIYEGSVSGVRSAISLMKGGKLLIKKGSFSNLGQGVVILVIDDAEITINDGEFFATNEEKPMISLSSSNNSTVIVNGGKFSGDIVSSESEKYVIDNRDSQ